MLTVSNNFIKKKKRNIFSGEEIMVVQYKPPLLFCIDLTKCNDVEQKGR